MKDFIFDTLMDSCKNVFRVNFKNYTIQIAKYKGERFDDFGEEQDLAQWIEHLLEIGEIYEEDSWTFRIFQAPPEILLSFIQEKKTSQISFRRREGDRIVWSRLYMLIPDQFPDSNPYIMVLTDDMNSAESRNYEANSVFAKMIHKIMRVDYLEDRVDMIKEYPSESYIHQKYQGSGISWEMQLVKEHLIYKDDVETFSSHINHDNIQQFFEKGNEYYVCYYRRKIGNLYRWVKMLIMPAPASSSEHPVYFYFIVDEHHEIMRMLDINNLLNYYKHYKLGLDNTVTENSYYENMMQVMNTFTDLYVDYYMIDLERDLYIKYKPVSGTLKKSIPNIGPYSPESVEYIEKYASGENARMLSRFCSSEKVREAITGKMMISFDFDSPEGERLRTYIRKIEEKEGIPTKVLCYTVHVEADVHKLRVITFGNFEVYLPDGSPFTFTQKQSRQLLAYLIDKQGYAVSNSEIVRDILERDESDLNAVKYVSTIIRRMVADLASCGFDQVVVKEGKSIRVNTEFIDCDYYRLLAGDGSMWERYHNEYMKEYSWAEETNQELLSMCRQI